MDGNVKRWYCILVFTNNTINKAEWVYTRVATSVVYEKLMPSNLVLRGDYP